MNSLENQLTSVLEHEALRAPLPNPEWSGPTYPMNEVPVRRSRRRSALVAIAAAAVIATALGATALRQHDPRDATVGSEPWRIGKEFPVRLSARTVRIDDSLAKPGSLTFIDVPGEAEPRSIYLTATYEPTGVIRATCLSLSPSSGACGDRAWGAGWYEDGPFVSWGAAPYGTGYASYDDGVTQQWQRVLGDYPIFRRGDGPTPVITAYDAAGTVLGQHSRAIAERNPLGPPDNGSRLEGIPNEWRNEAGDTFRATLRACIVNAGATITLTNVPVLPPGTDDNAIWDRCIDEAKRDADQRFVNLGGKLPIP
jgi:hypothetical protein